MNVNEMAKTMTREEFLLEVRGLCPKSFGLIKFHSESSECTKFEDCSECREYAIKDIQFKGEEDSIIEKPTDNYKWIFNIQEFKEKNVVINCKTKEESEQLFDILIKNGVMWQDDTMLKMNDTGFEKYETQTCYEIGCEYKLSFSDIRLYNKLKYNIYKFSEIDFSQVLTQDSINNTTLITHNDYKEEYYKLLTQVKALKYLKSKCDTYIQELETKIKNQQLLLNIKDREISGTNDIIAKQYNEINELRKVIKNLARWM